MKERNHSILHDYGNNPLIFNIDAITKLNTNFRTTLWTGKYLQLTVMSIPVGKDIGLEMHSYLDQFIKVESGNAFVMMGKTKENLDYCKKIDNNYAIIIPANTYHNIINIGQNPLKLYSIYAPPQHPFNTIHKTKEDAEE